MHLSKFIEADRPHRNVIEAAARELYVWGNHHGWWPETASTLYALDPISREEFEAIVERVLMSAAAATRGVAPDAA